MAIRIFRAVVGVFSFRRQEIAELDIEQQMDAAGYQPLSPPETVERRGVLYVQQSGIQERDLVRNKTSVPK